MLHEIDVIYTNARGKRTRKRLGIHPPSLWVANGYWLVCVLWFATKLFWLPLIYMTFILVKECLLYSRHIIQNKRHVFRSLFYSDLHATGVKDSTRCSGTSSTNMLLRNILGRWTFVHLHAAGFNTNSVVCYHMILQITKRAWSMEITFTRMEIRGM